MINPADMKKMLQRAHAAAQSAQNLTKSEGSHSTSQHIELSFSSQYSDEFYSQTAEYHIEYDAESDTLSETSHIHGSSSTIIPLYSTSSEKDLEEDDASETTGLLPHHLRERLLHVLEEQSRYTESGAPTPAIMAKKREDNTPTTFASLDNHDLPVVREYSAGGLVFDDHDRVAIIARHSRSGHLEWCLPKGHIEKGETPDQTAVREIHEETGILGEVVDSIATIDYWFTGDAQRIHKLVHHYALRMVGGYLTVEGDPDHEAEDATWVNFDDLTDVLSYPNERRIVWLYAKKHRRDSL